MRSEILDDKPSYFSYYVSPTVAMQLTLKAEAYPYIFVTNLAFTGCRAAMSGAWLCRRVMSGAWLCRMVMSGAWLSRMVM